MICSVVEAKNLGSSLGIKDEQELVIEPYVRITTEIHEPDKQPVLMNKPITTQIAQPSDQTSDRAAAIR